MSVEATEGQNCRLFYFSSYLLPIYSAIKSNEKKKKKTQHNSQFLTPSKASNSMTYVWKGLPQNKDQIWRGDTGTQMSCKFSICYYPQLDWMVNRSLTKLCLSWFKVIFSNINVIDYYMFSVSVISNSKSRVEKIRKRVEGGKCSIGGRELSK